MTEIIKQAFDEHRRTLEAYHQKVDEIRAAGECWRAALAAGKTIFFCGNGGSAADAQHLAAELVGRYVKERPSLAGVALTTDTSALTAIANDYGYERVFARQVEGLCRAGDVLVAISTSGNSPNVVAAAKAAQAKGMKVVALTGAEPCALDDVADHILHVPAATTARIQEMHILTGHILCEMVDSDAR